MHKANLTLLWLLFPSLLPGQTQWRRSEIERRDLQLFHSVYAINQPTAETLQKGDFEFEISHRFIPALSEGSAVLWGIDGPVNMRVGLAYALTDRTLLTLGRSNLDDNIDLQVKFKGVQVRNEVAPVLISLQAGLGYNSQVFLPIENNSRKYQPYFGVILTTLIKKRLGIGVAPVYLYNSAIYNEELENTFAIGTYGQFYLSPSLSIVAEWSPVASGWKELYNSGAFGIELETGGHFFKIFVTNNSKINASHYVIGSDAEFKTSDLRLGFLITRLLKF